MDLFTLSNSRVLLGLGGFGNPLEHCANDCNYFPECCSFGGKENCVGNIFCEPHVFIETFLFAFRSLTQSLDSFPRTQWSLYSKFSAVLWSYVAWYWPRLQSTPQPRLVCHWLWLLGRSRKSSDTCTTSLIFSDKFLPPLCGSGNSCNFEIATIACQLFYFVKL